MSYDVKKGTTRGARIALWIFYTIYLALACFYVWFCTTIFVNCPLDAGSALIIVVLAPLGIKCGRYAFETGAEINEAYKVLKWEKSNEHKRPAHRVL